MTSLIICPRMNIGEAMGTLPETLLKGDNMVTKYYDGAVEQVIAGLGKNDTNSLLVRYGGDFSIQNLRRVKKAEISQKYHLVTYEYTYGEIAGGYEPYLSVICDMFRKYKTGTFGEFLEECDVYHLHRPILQSYFESGICKREEQILLDEVEYEQKRMIDALEMMLLKLSEACPVVFVLNRFQLAARSTMVLTRRLLSNQNKNIGLLFGINEVQSIPEFLMPEWDLLYEALDDGSRVYHIGNAEKIKKKQQETHAEEQNKDSFWKINNLVELLDFEQALYWLGKIERRIKFDNLVMEDVHKEPMWLLYARASIMTGDISKALEICEDLERMHLPGRELSSSFSRTYLMALAYMYQGKLTEAITYARRALQMGVQLKDAYSIFQAELLETQVQMSGWYNIFFCAQDVKVSDALIEKLMKYNYKNHLAHIYIYAYDNKPEIVAKAYRAEELLRYFSKGVKIAKELGNEQLVNNAYQKNIMLASTNGMYEISLLYSVRTYESLKDHESVEAGRIYSGIAYNLCAVGENERAEQYYASAIRLFYRLKRPEDIAEVLYNMSLNAIMCEEYAKAETYLMQSMKAIEKLHLNSLRVCNLSKLYGLLALVSILQENRFHCERYLYNCRQFLSYVLEKEKLGNEFSVIHDYAKIDDDMFLYTFSKALLAQFDGKEVEAAALYEKAEEYLKNSEGNQFFSYAIFRKSRIACYKALKKDQLCKEETEALRLYEQSHRSTLGSLAEEVLLTLPLAQNDARLAEKEICWQEIDDLIWQNSMILAYKSKKQQLDFISTWQKQIDVTGIGAKEMLETVMKTFLNHFNIDCAVYVRYIERTPQILYNNTGKTLTPKLLGQIADSFRKNAAGFAISKISSNYMEHQDITSIFGDDEVCSMVAIPFFNNSKVESFLIAYVLMKDNWHSSVNRYMLDEDDLNMYQLLFREVRYSLNRLDAYDKIYEMNTKLYLSAVTDHLTGIYNREGFFQKINTLQEEISRGERKADLGLMFIDLDNFKHYNDTFGHDIGDLILKQMAEIFQRISKGRGFVCRYGGDEFVIVFDTADKQELEACAKEIYLQIDKADGFSAEISQKLGHAVCVERDGRISCSIGIVAAESIQNAEQINEMMKQADDLLYTIKTSTKGTYRI